VTKAVEAPVSAHETVTRPRPGEWIITVLLLAFFAAGYLLAEDFPFRAALFPQMVAVLGFVLSVFRILGLIRQTVRGRRAPVSTPAVAPTPDAAGESPPAATAPPAAAAPAAAAVPAAAGTGATAATAATGDTGTAGEGPAADRLVSNLEIVDDDIEDDASMEYVFATAGGRAWLAALSWIVAFFVAFFVLGAFVSVPLFAFLYLRFSGRASWLAAGIYAAVTGVLIYLVFQQLVFIPLPTGYIPFLQL
jgi:hypothetical protein